MMNVSVALMVRPHDCFVDQAIESALKQHVNFDYEIVIGIMDASEPTRARVLHYQAEHPDKIRLLLSHDDLDNLDKPPGIRLLRACQGAYISYLDGDDYWISPDKLQRQVDFLDQHPECVSCYHSTKIISATRRRWTFFTSPKARDATQSLGKKRVISPSSMMFQQSLLHALPEWIDPYFEPDDWMSYMLTTCQGLMGYIDDPMSIRRYRDAFVPFNMSRLDPQDGSLPRSYPIENQRYSDKARTSYDNRHQPYRLSGFRLRDGRVESVCDYSVQGREEVPITQNLFGKPFYRSLFTTYCPRLFLHAVLWKRKMVKGLNL